MERQLRECKEGQRELNRIIVESNNMIRETEVKYKGYLKQFAIDTTTARKEAESEMDALKKTLEDLKPGIKKAYEMYQNLGAGHSDYIQPDGEKGCATKYDPSIEKLGAFLWDSGAKKYKKRKSSKKARGSKKKSKSKGKRRGSLRKRKSKRK
jgi:hypothetical protein|tara:strand:+ start:138 stop:596 length:459 start_codon:yes stop_codon:yes gene_type:complete